MDVFVMNYCIKMIHLDKIENTLHEKNKINCLLVGCI